jgi:type I restriction enzyme S subunit
MSKAIPKLRFKEFNETWLKSDLGEKVNSISSGKIKPLDAGNYNVYGSTGIIGKSHEYSHDGDYLLVARVGANAGMINRVSGKYGVTDNTLVVNLKADILVPFCEGFLTKFNLNKLIFGSGQPLITGGLLKSIKISFPTLPEQQKIASFLSAVDEKIQQLTRKKELLEQYKKGVMQQLFSSSELGFARLEDDRIDADDKNNPTILKSKKSKFRQLRFKDENGKAYPKWEEKRLGDIGDIVSGLTYSPMDVNADGVLVLRSSNVQNRRLTFEDNVYVKVSAGEFNPVKENDILICVRNGSKNLIGKNALIDRENAGVAFGAFMTVYRSYFNSFLFHYFDTDSYKDEVHKNLGATINSINGSDLKKFKIPFPCKEEQQKIASFLSAIDTKIESVAIQIEKTQTFKKGLLQQMFV